MFIENIDCKNGHYEDVSPPWETETPELPTNNALAVGRLNSTSKNLNNANLFDDYSPINPSSLLNKIVTAATFRNENVNVEKPNPVKNAVLPNCEKSLLMAKITNKHPYINIGVHDIKTSKNLRVTEVQRFNFNHKIDYLLALLDRDKTAKHGDTYRPIARLEAATAEQSDLFQHRVFEETFQTS